MNKKRISKMKQLPCVKDKCLKYPSCITRHSIKCIELSLYYQFYMSINLSYPLKTVWFKMNKALPHLNTIKAIKIGEVWHMEVWKPIRNSASPEPHPWKGKCAK